jgi:ferredoxin
MLVARAGPVGAGSGGRGPREFVVAAGRDNSTAAYATITPMAYVIAEPCIGTKDNSCVEVCPVDCIHPTPDEPDYDTVKQLYIDPDECIDCDACVEACPVDACFAEDQLPDEWGNFAQLNADYFAGR